MRSLHIAVSGMLAQQHNVSVTANNISNSRTTSFKRQEAQFEDVMYQTQRAPGTQSSSSGTILPSGIQYGLGVRIQATARHTHQGELAQTSNPLDLAIEGKGYLQVTMPDGTLAYTRAGNLGKNANGVIVTQEGYPIVPQITVPQEATDVAINQSGEVFVKLATSTTPQNIGQIELASFVNPTGLFAEGGNLFRETQASGAATPGQAGLQGMGVFKQGFLEISNVDPVSEIIHLIEAQRAYEMNSKVIQVSDEMMSVANRMRG